MTRRTRTQDSSFLALLKTCAKTKDLSKGTRVHSLIVKMGLLEKNPYLVSSLVNMYIKCGKLAKAHQLHDELLARSVASWNALIAGYAQSGHGDEAMSCYEQMQREGFTPNAVTFVGLLKACSSTGAIDKGKQIHDEIISRGSLKEDIVLGTALIFMYAKFNMLIQAQEVHDELLIHDTASWNALISGYVQQGQGYEALNSFEQMQREGLPPNAVTYTCVLKACGSIGDVNTGEKIHNEIVKTPWLKDTVLTTTLVDMYIKCGVLAKAEDVHNEYSIRDTVAWNALIAGYAQQNQGYNALVCFERMQDEGISPNAATFVSVLKACGSTRSIVKGKEIHDEIVVKGFLLEKESTISAALVDMYAKCGLIAKAQEVHDELQVRNVVTWSALIAGYVENSQYHEALKCFELMECEGIFPSMATFVCVLKACANIGAIDKGHQIHDEIVNRKLLDEDVVLGAALVDMYAKCGVLARANKVFCELSIRNTASWNALIAGYTQQGQGHEALDCFQRMENEGHSADAVTFTCILKACRDVGSIEIGKQIHHKVVCSGLLGTDVLIGTALVGMYALCGLPIKAQEVLEELPVRNVASWSALISGYAQQGQVDEALKCFQCMQGEGLSPDFITFLCLLNACSHSGLLDEAQMYFHRMNKQHGITPTMEHHACLVVVLGYAGYFDKALSMIKMMPFSDYPSIWLVLLGACKKWGNIKFGRLAFDQIVQVDQECCAAYVLMCGIYAAAGMKKEAENISTMGVRNAGVNLYPLC